MHKELVKNQTITLLKGWQKKKLLKKIKRDKQNQIALNENMLSTIKQLFKKRLSFFVFSFCLGRNSQVRFCLDWLDVHNRFLEIIFLDYLLRLLLRESCFRSFVHSFVGKCQTFETRKRSRWNLFAVKKSIDFASKTFHPFSTSLLLLLQCLHNPVRLRAC
jgi:hypothetical protein